MQHRLQTCSQVHPECVIPGLDGHDDGCARSGPHRASRGRIAAGHWLTAAATASISDTTRSGLGAGAIIAIIVALVILAFATVAIYRRATDADNKGVVFEHVQIEPVAAVEAQEFLDTLSKKFLDYNAEDLETLAWSVDKDHVVPLIDADTLAYNGKWRVCASYAWNRKGHISVLEARTLGSTLRHAISKGLRDSRLFVISESMAAIMSGTKGRSSKPRQGTRYPTREKD